MVKSQITRLKMGKVWLYEISLKLALLTVIVRLNVAKVCGEFNFIFNIEKLCTILNNFLYTCLKGGAENVLFVFLWFST